MSSGPKLWNRRWGTARARPCRAAQHGDQLVLCRDRHFAFDGCPAHNSAMLGNLSKVVRHSVMQTEAVVPQRQRTLLPVQPATELGLRRVLIEKIDKRRAFALSHPLEPRGERRAQAQGFAATLGMTSDNRVHCTCRLITKLIHAFISRRPVYWGLPTH
jgi:hypothetical protein